MGCHRFLTRSEGFGWRINADKNEIGLPDGLGDLGWEELQKTINFNQRFLYLSLATTIINIMALGYCFPKTYHQLYSFSWSMEIFWVHEILNKYCVLLNVSMYKADLKWCLQENFLAFTIHYLDRFMLRVISFITRFRPRHSLMTSSRPGS